MVHMLSRALLFAAFLLAHSTAWGQNITGKVEIHFIDIGQGDAILVMSPNRECVMIIDSGDTRYPGASKFFKAYIQDHLPLGSKIDLVVASHPHSDHISSLQWVLQNYQVKSLIDNGQEVPRTTENGNPTLFGKLMSEVENRVNKGVLKHFAHTQAPMQEQDFCAAENLNTALLFPQGGYDSAFCDKNPNNCSVLVKMTYDATTFLFPGDAEKEQEELLLQDSQVRQNLPAKVLKVPHHGSDTSSTIDFLNVISPQWMVVSAGHKNVGTNKTFMHPRLSTINNLLLFAGEQNNPRDIDAFDSEHKVWALKTIFGNLFVTAKDGTVVLSSDGKEIRRE